MKIKFLFTIMIMILSVGIIAAYGTNQVFATANNAKDNINVELISATYSSDHVAVEYRVKGQITSSDGILTGCPVNSSSILNDSAQEFNGGNADFMDCRPDGNDSYLVTQFIYNDFSAIKNKPKKVKIKIGDVDFMNMTNCINSAVCTFNYSNMMSCN